MVLGLINLFLSGAITDNARLSYEKKERHLKFIIFLGFILAGVGMDIVSGKLRMTFGTVPLMGGFHFIVAVIGLFGIGEIFLTVEEGLKMEGVKAKVTFQDIWEGLKELFHHRRILLMGSLIGCWLGIQPGGATPASFMAYGFAKSSASDKDQYGKGASSGVIAPEAAGHGAGREIFSPLSDGQHGHPSKGRNVGIHG
jgi:putative tricarboxylic transport membrane protein